MPLFWQAPLSRLILITEINCVSTQIKIATNQSLNLSPVVSTVGLTFFGSYYKCH